MRNNLSVSELHEKKDNAIGSSLKDILNTCNFQFHERQEKR